jgi:hypothetical protein
MTNPVEHDEAPCRAACELCVAGGQSDLVPTKEPKSTIPHKRTGCVLW